MEICNEVSVLTYLSLNFYKYSRNANMIPEPGVEFLKRFVIPLMLLQVTSQK